MVELVAHHSKQALPEAKATELVKRLVEDARTHTSPDSTTPTPEKKPQRVQRRLTTEQSRDLVTRYQASVPAIELAKVYGISRNSVLNIVEAAGLPRQVGRMTANDQATAIQLYETGMSCATIAEQFGRSPGTIWHLLKRSGVSLRDTHGRRTRSAK